MGMQVGEKSSKLNSEINITPLADVMLVLLIIVMLIAPPPAGGCDADAAGGVQHVRQAR